jgi:hypothetical protein
MTKIGWLPGTSLNTKRFGQDKTPRLNGNSKVKSTADDEIAPAEELEYIFREVFYLFSFSFRFWRVAAAVSVSCSDHCVSTKSSLYLRHVLKVPRFEERRVL